MKRIDLELKMKYYFRHYRYHHGLEPNGTSCSLAVCHIWRAFVGAGFWKRERLRGDQRTKVVVVTHKFAKTWLAPPLFSVWTSNKASIGPTASWREWERKGENNWDFICNRLSLLLERSNKRRTLDASSHVVLDDDDKAKECSGCYTWWKILHSSVFTRDSSSDLKQTLE